MPVSQGVREPLAAKTALGTGEREFVMRAESGEQPSRGVAEAFAGVAAPAGRAAADIFGTQRIFAPFGAPTQLPRCPRGPLMH